MHPSPQPSRTFQEVVYILDGLGDQFDQTNKPRAKVVFGAFYRDFDSWAGPHAVRAGAARPPNPHSFLRVARTALAAGHPGLVLAVLGMVLAVAAFLFVPSFGFVIVAGSYVSWIITGN